MHLPLPPGLPLDTCSREGWGIGEGMAMLFTAALTLMAVVYTVALVSGWIVGRRRGRVGRQLLLHLIAGTGVLVAVPIIGLVVAAISNELARIDSEHHRAIVDAWLAPLRQPAQGAIDDAIRAVEAHPEMQNLARRSYLIAVLPEIVGQFANDSDADDATALRALATRLRHENQGSHPHNLDRLDGAIEWFVRRPQLTQALQACESRGACKYAVLDFAISWCGREGQACHEGLREEDLEAAAPGFAGDEHGRYRLGILRTRVLALSGS